MSQKRAALLLSAIFIVLSLCTAAAFAETSAQARKVVRVGYPIQPGLTEVDQFGNHLGYLYEYLEEVAQYTGWEYEFVQVPGDINESLTSFMGMLESGDIDLMGALLYSEDLAERFDFVGYSIGTVNTTLETLADDNSTWMVEMNIGRTVRVATLKTSGPRVEEMLTYCAMNQITPEMVLCDSDEAQLQALREGRADALLSVSISPVKGTRIVAKFAPRPFYCAVTKGRTDLISEMNAAIYSIEQADPFFTTRLYEKYFAHEDTTLTLSDRERAYVAQADTLRVGAIMNMPPFQYEDQDGYCGISFDLLDYISQQSGLTFEVVPVDTQEELDALVARQAVDVIAGMTYEYNSAGSKKIAMTRPYTSMQYMLMLNPRISEEALAGKRLALPTQIAYRGTFVGDVVRYDTQAACIKAVNNGTADYTYADAYVAQFYVNQVEYSSIHLVPQFYALHRTCLGIVKPISSELLSILNKTILTISPESMQRIIYQNTTLRTAPTLQYWMRTYPMQSLLLVSGVLLCVIGVLAWGMSARGRMNRKVSLDMKKYTEIYELSSERFFEYDYKTDYLMVAARDGEAGHAPGALRGYHLAELRTEQERHGLDALVGLLRTRREGTEEVCLPCPDGETHWLRFTMKTIYDGTIPAYVIGKIVNIDGEREAREALLYRAQHDSLTDLLNTAVFRQEVTALLESPTPWAGGALLLIDVDVFKMVNDTYGHLEGDRILVQVGDLLRTLFPDEILGRTGGDEFAAFLGQSMDLDGISARCAALCQQMRGVALSNGSHITCSIGAALSRQGQTYDALYEQADRLLYLAKDKGRDRFEAGPT